MFGAMPAWRGHGVWELKTPCRPIIFLLSSVTGQNACTHVFCILRWLRTVCTLTVLHHRAGPTLFFPVPLYSSRVQSEAMLYIQTPPNRSGLSPLSAPSERHQTNIISSLQHMWIKSAVLCKMWHLHGRLHWWTMSAHARWCVPRWVRGSWHPHLLYNPFTNIFTPPPHSSRHRRCYSVNAWVFL